MKQGLPRRTAERWGPTAVSGALPSGVPRQLQRLRKPWAYRQSRTRL